MKRALARVAAAAAATSRYRYRLLQAWSPGLLCPWDRQVRTVAQPSGIKMKHARQQ